MNQAIQVRNWRPGKNYSFFSRGSLNKIASQGIRNFNCNRVFIVDPEKVLAYWIFHTLLEIDTVQRNTTLYLQFYHAF